MKYSPDTGQQLFKIKKHLMSCPEIVSRQSLRLAETLPTLLSGRVSLKKDSGVLRKAESNKLRLCLKIVETLLVLSIPFFPIHYFPVSVFFEKKENYPPDFGHLSPPGTALLYQFCRAELAGNTRF